jgi:two-component system phosphate regulon sensor histidine kinase PhoR
MSSRLPFGSIVLSAVASSVALLAILMFLGPRLQREAEDRAFDGLVAEARLMAKVVEPALARGEPPAVVDRLVDEAARDVKARVTIVAPDGRVLADSALPEASLAAAENHAQRPEVKEALAARIGRARRLSATVGDELLYAAVPIQLDGQTVAVSRVALPLGGITARVRRMQPLLALGLVAAAAMVAAAALLGGSRFRRVLTDVTSAAGAFAAGDLSARVRVDRDDELGRLAGHLNRMATQLDERLTQSARDKRRTDAILEAMDDGLLAVDTRGTVVLANEALVRDLGLQDPVGRHYLEVVRQPEVDGVVKKVLSYGRRSTAEIEIARFKRSFVVAGVPLAGAGDVPQGAILTFHDVTQERRLESVRRDFVANASHELRTPLTSIRGFVEALEDGALREPGTAERFLGKIRVHADRMAELIEDLLELSRLESGSEAVNRDPVIPARVAASVVGSFAERAAAKRIGLALRGQTEAAVMTDGERLRRILENLLDNAIKYTPEGGDVTVVVRGNGDEVAIDVADTGPGIPSEHLSRIFERFYRVDKSRSRDLGGTGLGLSIVKHLAEGIGGRVSVESTPGRGSTFTITLPGSNERPAAG